MWARLVRRVDPAAVGASRLTPVCTRGAVSMSASAGTEPAAAVWSHYDRMVLRTQVDDLFSEVPVIARAGTQPEVARLAEDLTDFCVRQNIVSLDEVSYYELQDEFGALVPDGKKAWKKGLLKQLSFMTPVRQPLPPSLPPSRLRMQPDTEAPLCRSQIVKKSFSVSAAESDKPGAPNKTKKYAVSKQQFQALHKVYVDGLTSKTTGLCVFDWDDIEDGAEYDSEPGFIKRMAIVEGFVRNSVAVHENTASAHVVKELSQCFEGTVRAIPAMRRVFTASGPVQRAMADLIVASIEDEDANDIITFSLQCFLDKNGKPKKQILYEWDAVCFIPRQGDSEHETEPPVLVLLEHKTSVTEDLMNEFAAKLDKLDEDALSSEDATTMARFARNVNIMGVMYGSVLEDHQVKPVAAAAAAANILHLSPNGGAIGELLGDSSHRAAPHRNCDFKKFIRRSAATQSASAATQSA